MAEGEKRDQAIAVAVEAEGEKRNEAIIKNNEEVVRPMVKSEVAAGAQAFAEKSLVTSFFFTLRN